ncbi:Transcription initiation factor IIB-2 [Zea mays]|jgi:transcription initiation factor TFIIB|uniref:Plant-specific TFIIB-related protein 2 n=2 Tax=Zea mays TaxID=4577 RepID=A0A1D6MBN6_MAIZE|nr:transcription initiation factor IIB [Zea mays]AQK88170.1 Plant-specific TFIIB-related protein 2 [Zea mays]PWZ17231.1 Transcription initiation factor IIB-2 [Zea mays]|eukprot:XP_008649960.1 transcription initiation factor IIB [Zea mays]
MADDEPNYCPDCHRTTEVVLDHATGDTICTECALVLEAHYIDEGSEWRNFADDGGGEDRDPSRVGGSSDPFLANMPLVTQIAYAGPQKAQGEGGHALPRLHVSASGGAGGEQTLVEGFHAIADMADRLGLVATIRDRAKDVYKRLGEARACPGRGKKRDAFYAACLYVACRNEGKPRTYKELATVTSDGAAAKKEIGKMTMLIKKVLGEEAGQVMDIGVVRPSDYMRRFCSRLGMGNREMRAAQEAARRLENGLDVRRNPESIAAAISYMVVQRTGAGKTVRDVSMATGVAEVTIKEAHKDLTPHAEKLFA